MQLDGGELEIRIEGELDLAVADRLERAIERAGEADVLIDLGACEFIDSSAIAVILQSHRLALEAGRRLVVHSPENQVLKILQVTGISGNGLVFETRDAALAIGPGAAAGG
jgi:anti-sigma B factor antagonist